MKNYVVFGEEGAEGKGNEHFRKCEEESKPCVWVRPSNQISTRRKYLWAIEIDFITFQEEDRRPKLEKESLEEFRKFLDSEEIEYKLSNMTPRLGDANQGYLSIFFKDKEKAKKAVEFIAERAMKERNWVDY